MACQCPLRFPTSTTMNESENLWGDPDTRNPNHRITCGILPTLQALSTLGSNNQETFCLVPCDMHLDSASHLQMILLEAYCREIGVEVMRVPKRTLQAHCMGVECNNDLFCMLISNDDSYFLESPE